MRPAFAAALAALTLIASAETAPAQQYYSTFSGIQSCNSTYYQSVGATPASARCSTPTPNPLAYTADALVNLNAGGLTAMVDASSLFSGTLPVGETLSADTQGSIFQFFTLGGIDPTTIFKIVVQAATTMTAVASDQTSQLVEAELDLGTVDAFGNPNDLGISAFRQALFSAAGGMNPANANQSLTTTLFQSDIGSNSTFYFALFAKSTSQGFGGTPGLGAWGSSSIFNPTIQVYLSNNQLATNYTISYNPAPAAPITSTPEPASLTLMATGLAAVTGAARRKRRVALAEAAAR